MDTSYKCEICGQLGAKFKRYRTVTGLLLFSTTGYTKPMAVCEKHKMSAGMNTNVRNLVLGWWGIHAFFWNIMAFIENLNGGDDVTKTVEATYQKQVQENSDAMHRQQQL